MKKENKRRLYLQIMRELEQSIQNGQYPAGSRLPPEQQLAEQFQVSRPTIREATLALEVRGLVEARIGSGVYILPNSELVIDDSTGDILQNEPVSPFEILEAREVVEGASMLLAAKGANRSDLLRLKQNLQMQQEVLAKRSDKRPAREFLKLDEDFHLQIALMTQNLALYQVIRQLWRMRELSPLWNKLNEHFSQNVEDFCKAVSDHGRIYQALKAGDGQLANDLLHEHFQNTKQSLMELAGVDS